jgi:isocitrate/isopropylmalate dehydrogenase
VSAARRHRIAVIPGDGIGQEVIPAGLVVLQRAAELGGRATTEDVARAVRHALQVD